MIGSSSWHPPLACGGKGLGFTSFHLKTKRPSQPQGVSEEVLLKAGSSPKIKTAFVVV